MHTPKSIMTSFQCSASCGKGAQSRKVTCGNDASNAENFICDKSTRPADYKSCFRACPASWVTGDWSPVGNFPTFDIYDICHSIEIT